MSLKRPDNLLVWFTFIVGYAVSIGLVVAKGWDHSWPSSLGLVVVLSCILAVHLAKRPSDEEVERQDLRRRQDEETESQMFRLVITKLCETREMSKEDASRVLADAEARVSAAMAALHAAEAQVKAVKADQLFLDLYRAEVGKATKNP